MRFLLFLFCFINSVFLLAQSNRIIVDEDFSDWQNISVAHTDPSGDSGNSNIDFSNLWISNDDDFIFFRLELGAEINLQDNNEITIYLDTDGNPGTGFSTDGVGAEIVYNFGNRSGTVYIDNNNAFIGHKDIWLTALPTVTSDEFEIALSRNLSFFGQDIYQGNTIRVLFKNNINNADQIPNNSGGVSYIFDNSIPSPLPIYTITQSPESQLRVMSYNVLFDNLFDPNLQSSFSRIIKSLNADIIGFQEIYDHTSAQTADKVQSFSPLGNGAQWYHTKIQPDIIAVSRFPIVDSHLIGVSNSSSDGNGAFLIDLDPATNTKLLLVVAHTPCCDNNFDRQREIDAIMAFIRNVKDGTGPMTLSPNDPIIIMGDMNLVGDKQQQTTLTTGDIVNQSSYGPDFNPDWDDTALEDAIPLASNLPLAFTWYKESSSFAPGRLDYIVYTGSVLDLKNTFSLYTPALSQSELIDHDLSLNDAVMASDHLPLVGDFDLNITIPAKDLTKNQNIALQVFPNPFVDGSNLMIELSQKSEVVVELFDVDGRQLELIHHGILTEGKHDLVIGQTNLPAGIYICRITTKFGVMSRKVFVLQ